MLDLTQFDGHTPGPWRWEINRDMKTLQLCGGRPQYDLTIMQPIRWGTHRATLMMRDLALDGMNLLHKLHERPDWIAPFAGREHHAAWLAGLTHPDALLSQSAPRLLSEVRALRESLSDIYPLAICHAAAVQNGTDNMHPDHVKYLNNAAKLLGMREIS